MSTPMTNLSTLTYPRTGKRGVPQQFPRRLYEMLESEAKLASTSLSEKVVISWSESGKAFRIVDVDSFVTSVLPKYFRTKKFSSFQRNLNLVSQWSFLATRFRNSSSHCNLLLLFSSVRFYQGSKRTRYRYARSSFFRQGLPRVPLATSKINVGIPAAFVQGLILGW